MVVRNDEAVCDMTVFYLIIVHVVKVGLLRQVWQFWPLVEMDKLSVGCCRSARYSPWRWCGS